MIKILPGILPGILPENQETTFDKYLRQIINEDFIRKYDGNLKDSLPRTHNLLEVCKLFISWKDNQAVEIKSVDDKAIKDDSMDNEVYGTDDPVDKIDNVVNNEYDDELDVIKNHYPKKPKKLSHEQFYQKTHKKTHKKKIILEKKERENLKKKQTKTTNASKLFKRDYVSLGCN